MTDLKQINRFKMKNIYVIFTAFLLIFSSSSNAEWPKLPEKKDDESFNDWNKNTANKFHINGKNNTSGISISAFDIDFSSLVVLRWNGNKVDYKILFLRSPPSSNFYVDLLDEDGFLIKEVFIAQFEENYKGKLYGSFDMKWEMFSKIKSYQEHLRATTKGK